MNIGAAAVADKLMLISSYLIALGDTVHFCMFRVAWSIFCFYRKVQVRIWKFITCLEGNYLSHAGASERTNTDRDKPDYPLNSM